MKSGVSGVHYRMRGTFVSYAHRIARIPREEERSLNGRFVAVRRRLSRKIGKLAGNLRVASRTRGNSRIFPSRSRENSPESRP